jgi:colicin import membrane protein
MPENARSAFVLSVTLHGAVVALIVFFVYLLRVSAPEMPKIFELVAGEGDNFAATEAPALSAPGISLNIPSPPVVRPRPVPEPPREVVQHAPEVPPVKAPAPKPVETKPVAETKPAPPMPKTMTKEEFDRLNKPRTTPAPRTPAPPRVPKINTDEIVKGVVGGSQNVKAGAGGRALTRDEGPVMDAYFALLRERLRAALEKPPGLADTLVTTIEVRIAADGTLSAARITRSSGSPEFDRAVLAAVARTRMPPRPDNKTELLAIPFHMKEL